MKRNILMISMLTTVFVMNANAGQVRSRTAINEFKQSHPCPANGNSKGACPGYVIDHMTPLACGGTDAPINMQWQTTAEAKAKDKWERADCGVFMDVRGGRSSSGGSRRSASGRRHSSGGAGYGGGSTSSPSGNGNYHVGPRGGCYTISSNGKKRYVAHSFCS